MNCLTAAVSAGRRVARRFAGVLVAAVLAFTNMPAVPLANAAVAYAGFRYQDGQSVDGGFEYRVGDVLRIETAGDWNKWHYDAGSTHRYVHIYQDERHDGHYGEMLRDTWIGNDHVNADGMWDQTR